MISEHGVKVLFTAPTAIRAIRKEDPDGAHLANYDAGWNLCSSPGSGWDPDTYRSGRARSWPSPLSITGGRPRRGGRSPPTRWGWSRCRSKRGLRLFRCRAMTCRSCMPDGYRLEAGEDGVICLKLPLPPGTLTTLWDDDARFVASYLSEHPGYYLTGDGGYIDEDGYLFVMGRIDDVISCGAQVVDGGARGRARRASRGGRVCRDRRRRRDRRPSAAGSGRAEGRRLG